MTAEVGPRLPLEDYQARAVSAVSGVIEKVAGFHEAQPGAQREIALKTGTTLLQGPTGSGKTLMLGRTIEGLRGKLARPTVWFWFAPYNGLVTQTREALAAQCGSIRLRDVTVDRTPEGSRDGDAFVQTWAAVASRAKEARRVRRGSENAVSLDDFIDAMRDRGFFIGVVIDEAHLNFGASAGVAASFYLDVLRPDFTILATATPNDEKLEAFEKVAGIEVASRVVVDREVVVKRGLNKHGLALGIIRFNEDDQGLVDTEQATLTAGWIQHRRIKARLAQIGLNVTPLMLVQVEDQKSGEEDPTARVRQKLLEIGVPPATIAVHTSGEPDPDFHTLAFDPSKEVLIFKVAVATGFDAPRAWTLVSVRPNRGKDFGLQIVGRIMRVHPLVRPIHGTDALLDRGYVFLTDAETQAGLADAVTELKAVRRSIELITDRLDLYEFGDRFPLSNEQSYHHLSLHAPRRPASESERQERLDHLIVNGLLGETVRSLPVTEQDQAIVTAETWQRVAETPLFGDLPLAPRDDQQHGRNGTPGTEHLYPLRRDLGLPRSLVRELPPRPESNPRLIEDIAAEFCRSSAILSLLQVRISNAQLSLRELFLAAGDETIDLKLRLSNARVAERAQFAFRFNDSIDPRELKRALVATLRAIVDDRGIEADDRDIRRAIDLAVMREPKRLTDAMRIAQARHAESSDSEPIPDYYIGPEGLQQALKSAYGIFPARLNGEERAFAEFLDTDRSGIVTWWLRNPENERWATRLLLPTGKSFFPDFAVGVSGRSSRDSIALIEIKDDGDTGRLQSDRNLDKIRVQHREYRNVFWTYRSDGVWIRAQYAEGIHRIIPRDRFDIAELVYLS